MLVGLTMLEPIAYGRYMRICGGTQSPRYGERAEAGVDCVLRETEKRLVMSLCSL